MILNFGNDAERYTKRLYVALIRAQGDILTQLETNSSNKEELKNEYRDLEEIARQIQRCLSRYSEGIVHSDPRLIDKVG